MGNATSKLSKKYLWFQFILSSLITPLGIGMEDEWSNIEDISKDKLKSPSSCRNKPYQRNAANARERARMRVLSKAFGRLKTTLPWVPPDTKLSKLDTLRLASSYIGHLRAILEEDQEQPHLFSHPLNLTWPFTFGSRNLTEEEVEITEDKLEASPTSKFDELTQE